MLLPRSFELQTRGALMYFLIYSVAMVELPWGLVNCIAAATQAVGHLNGQRSLSIRGSGCQTNDNSIYVGCLWPKRTHYAAAVIGRESNAIHVRAIVAVTLDDWRRTLHCIQPYITQFFYKSANCVPQSLFSLVALRWLSAPLNTS